MRIPPKQLKAMGLELRRQGMSVRQIAHALGVTRLRVLRWIGEPVVSPARGPREGQRSNSKRGGLKENKE